MRKENSMKAKDISAIDKNLSISQRIEEADIVFYNVKKAPFEVYGLYDYQNQPVFKRLPDEIAQQVNSGVAELYLHTAGGRVRFSTDSEFLIIRAVMNSVSKFPHMPLTGSSGFDLYTNDPESNTSRYVRTFVPPYDLTHTFESKIKLSKKQNRFFTIHFPSYSGVTELYVGVSNGSCIGEGMKYSNTPIVYYGSSITQGGCSSRPGNTYQNIISRRMNVDYINLGFSGSARAEDEIVSYMASLPMCAFVSDYDHNAPDVKHLQNTHCKMYQKIREAHPSIPYIMLSKCDFDSSYEDNILCREVVQNTYRYAKEHGDQNVYYIDGASIFRGPYQDMCTVDAVHPNDLGFALIADALEAELKRAFTQQLM